jgi:hypothetical protein
MGFGKVNRRTATSEVLCYEVLPGVCCRLFVGTIVNGHHLINFHSREPRNKEILSGLTELPKVGFYCMSCCEGFSSKKHAQNSVCRQTVQCCTDRSKAEKILRSQPAIYNTQGSRYQPWVK